MSKTFRFLLVAVGMAAGFLLGLWLNGHFHLQMLGRLDGELVDLSNPDSLMQAYKTNRMEWISRYGDLELPGWHYGFSVPSALAVWCGLFVFFALKLIMPRKSISQKTR